MKIDKNQNSDSACLTCPVRHISCFKKADAEAIAEVESCREVISLEPGESVPLNFGGERGCACVFMGRLTLNRLWRDRQGIVSICGPGKLIGVKHRRSEAEYSATAIDASTICFFSDKNFEHLRRKYPEIAEGTIDALLDSLDIADERIASLENHSLLNRVAATLLSLNKKFGISQTGESRIDVRLNRKTIAVLSGTVPESLARALTVLENEKIIARKGRAIHVLNLQRLRDMAAKK